MARPTQQVDVFTIQDRRGKGKTRPWNVRWRIEGHHRAKSFRTKPEADRYRSLLVGAVTRGERFDERTGEPASWAPAPKELQTHTWVRRSAMPCRARPGGG